MANAKYSLSSAFMINFFDYGSFKSFGVFFGPLLHDFGTSNVVLASWIAMSRAFTNISSPLSHWCTGKIGSKSAIIFGGIVCATTLSVASYMDNVSWFGVLITLAGCFFNLTYIASVHIIQDNFPGNTVKMLAYSSGGGAFGMMMFPPVFEFLIELYGWRGAFMLLGAVNMHLVVCGQMVTLDSAGKQKSPPKPEYRKLDDDKSTPILTKMANYFSFYFIENPRFISIIAAHLMNGFVFNGWTIFLVPHGVEKGLSPRMASFLSFSGGVGTLFGRPLVGPIMNLCKVTAVQYMIIMAVVNTVAFCMDMFADTFWLLAILAFINGFATTSLPVITFGAIAEILGETHAVEGYSLAWIFYGIGDFVGGFVLGLLLDKESHMLFLTLGGASLLIGFAALTSCLKPMSCWNL